VRVACCGGNLGWWPPRGTGLSTAGESYGTGCRHCRAETRSDLNAVTLNRVVEEKEVVVTSGEAHNQQY